MIFKEKNGQKLQFYNNISSWDLVSLLMALFKLRMEDNKFYYNLTIGNNLNGQVH